MEFLELASVKVEVLGVKRRGECRDCFKRGAPESGYEVHCERERCHGHEEAAYGCVAHLAVVAETQFAEQVYSEQYEEHYPYGYEHFAVEYAPAIGKVGHRQELERQYKLYEAEHNFDGVEPAARAGQLLEHRREERKQAERQSQTDCEASHTQQWTHKVLLGKCLYEQRADDGARA